MVILFQIVQVIRVTTSTFLVIFVLCIKCVFKIHTLTCVNASENLN